MKLLASLDSLNLPGLFANARKRIILHAAIYGPFANLSSYKKGLLQALAMKSFEKLDIIALTADSPEPLKRCLLDLLRPHISDGLKEKEITDSDYFLANLKTAAPEKVSIHPLSVLPYQPIIIIDNTLIFGQYARCEKKASEGFWGIIETEVEKLLAFAQTADIPAGCAEQEIAAYRLICECCRAMTSEKT